MTMSLWLEHLQTLFVAATGAGDIEAVNSLLSQVPDLAIDGVCKESCRMALNAAVVELIKKNS